MLKIFHAKFQQYLNWELPYVQAGFRKGRGTKDQIANIHWIMKKAKEFQQNIYFCFIDFIKAFDCVDHNKLWKTLQEMGIPDWETCVWVKKQQLEFEHGITDWFKIGQGVCQNCILSLSLFNFYAEYIIRNSGLDES